MNLGAEAGDKPLEKVKGLITGSISLVLSFVSFGAFIAEGSRQIPGVTSARRLLSLCHSGLHSRMERTSL